MRRFGFGFMRVLGVLAIAMFAFATPALADDDDDGEFGAYIYEGTVDDYDERPLEDVGELESVRDDDDDDDDDLDDVWGVIGEGEPAPDPLYGEEDDDIDRSIDQLTADPHVLVVHAGESPSTPVIAIGAIEGELDEDGTLMIDLEEVDDSGFEGRAHFAPDFDEDDDDDVDDDDTEVTVGIWHVEDGAQGV